MQRGNFICNHIKLISKCKVSQEVALSNVDVDVEEDTNERYPPTK